MPWFPFLFFCRHVDICVEFYVAEFFLPRFSCRLFWRRFWRLFCRLFWRRFSGFLPSFYQIFCRLFVDFLLKISVESYAVSYEWVSSVSSEASQNGRLCHSYCTRSHTWTSEGVRLPNYIPTLQANPGGRNFQNSIDFNLIFSLREIG